MARNGRRYHEAVKIFSVIVMWTGVAWAQPLTPVGAAGEAGGRSPAATAGPNETAAKPAGPDADAAFAAGRYREAQAGYARAIRGRPDSPELHYRHAVAAAAAGDAPTAEREAATVVRLDPGNPDAVALAVSQRLAQRRTAAPVPTPDEVERALADGRLRTAARLAADALASVAPEDGAKARLLAARGRALLAVGRPRAASVALREAAGLGVDGPRVWLALAQAYAAEGRQAAAISCFEAAAAIAPAGGPVAKVAREAMLTLRRARGKGPR